MSTNSELLGVVLCGGESRRMGRDKGLLETAGRPWALRMGDRLLQQRLPVVYSINFSQWSAYSALVPAERLVVDATEGEGPLKGVLSVCGRFPGRDLLVLACDMQDIDDATLGRLIGAWRAGGGEGYAYEAGGSLQPLCAIYTAGLLAGAGEKRSLREVLSGGAVCRLQGEPEAFRNYNTL